MKNENVAHRIKGMNRDIGESSSSPEYAFEINNMRLSIIGQSSLMALKNEKGNTIIPNTSFLGSVLGYSVINNILIIFTTEKTANNNNGTDHIYKFVKNDDSFAMYHYFYGDLNFRLSNPIECQTYYENESILKVYWIDGINLPRFLNAALNNVDPSLKDSFNFIALIGDMPLVAITKNNTGTGLFHSGIVQYAFTYYNFHGQESNIFYLSDIFYLSKNDRGGSPEETTSNSFDITIEQANTKFDYLRIYLIVRTSLNTTPEVKIVTDIKIDGSTITYTDTNNSGTAIDATQLFYVGGLSIIPYAMAQKDNHLFLGNIQLERKNILNLYVQSGITAKSFFKNSFSKLLLTNYKNYFIPVKYQGYYYYKNLLIDSISRISYFKSYETYRLGVLLQYKTGEWSDVLYIGDYEVNKYPTVLNAGTINEEVELPQISTFATTLKLLSDGVTQDTTFIARCLNAINVLKADGYINYRTVIVYPTINDRSCICQGALCPTLFNIEDRYNNSPFAQSSWFARPNCPANSFMDDYFPILYYNKQVLILGDESGSTNNKSAEDKFYEEVDKNDPNDFFEIFLTSAVSDPNKTTEYNINNGIATEFRHYHQLPANYRYNAEIQSSTGRSSLFDVTRKYKNDYYVDLSIITMHSPDIEFDTLVLNLDYSNLKLRIIGLIPINANSSDIDITTSSAPANFFTDNTNTKSAYGFYKDFIGATSIKDSENGWKSAVSAPYWLDEVYGSNYLNVNFYNASFIIYPWHSSGSLNNCWASATNTAKTSLLKRKILSNLHYSANTLYLYDEYLSSKDVISSTNLNPFEYDTTGPILWNGDKNDIVKLNAPIASGVLSIVYKGSIDKILSTASTERYIIWLASRLDANDSFSHMFRRNARRSLTLNTDSNYQEFHVDSNNTNYIKGFDPINIKYNSTPHIVMAIQNYIDNNNVLTLKVLPSIGSNNNVSTYMPNEYHYYWNVSNNMEIFQPQIDSDHGVNLTSGYLWLGELYRDVVDNRFGGTTDNAIRSNIWQVAGKINPIDNLLTGIKWEYGDTFYLRYDCLKTYSQTEEDDNSIIDILSFMCETHLNIDGRYDKNRGLMSNNAITNENFNLLNNVYSQLNNLFTYTIPDESLLINNFPNQLTFTENKINNSKIDKWTNITLASVLNVDGDKGSIQSIKNFNNELFCFQNKGISNILFNKRVLVSASDGVPILIANSGTVDGVYYISSNIGCNNKWSIITTPNGIYFIDNTTNAIYLMSTQLLQPLSLSDLKGFKSWVNSYTNRKPYSKLNDNFISFYDYNNNDIYFNLLNNSLNFSELTKEFSSFFPDYGGCDAMFNIDDSFYAIKNNSLWLQFSGDYSKFFGNSTPSDYSIEFYDIGNSPYINKNYDRVEFYSNNEDNKCPFYEIDIDDDYQLMNLNIVNLNNNTVSSIEDQYKIIRKFRLWRIHLQNSKTYTTDLSLYGESNRISNMWVRIKLKGNQTINSKIQNILVSYYV